MKFFKLILLCFLGVGIQFLSALPQMWQQELPIRQGMNIDWNRTTSVNPDGTMIIAWSDTRNGERDLWVQKVDSAGNYLWNNGNPLLVTSGSNLQISPIIIPTTDNCVVIAWITTYYPSEDPILAQKLNQDGEFLWQDNGMVVCEGMDFITPLYGCSDNAGGVYLSWTVTSNPTTDIYAAHVLASGCQTWGANGIVIANNNTDEEVSCMTEDGAGGFIISYTSRVYSQYTLYLNRILVNGSSAWNGAHVLSNLTGSQERVRIAPDGTGSFMMTWISESNPSHPRVYTHRINRDGQFLWDNPIPVCTEFTDYSQFNPQIITSSDTGVIVVWEDQRTGWYNNDIFAQKISTAGVLLWNTSGLPIVVTEYDQINPRLVDDASGGCFIVWDELQNGQYSTRDIHAQHILGDGSKTWDENGNIISNAAYDQYDATILRKNDKLFISWADCRSGSHDLYYQVLSTNGAQFLEQNGKLICSGLDGDASQQKIFTLGDKALIIWEDARQSYTGNQIYFQIIRPDKTLLLPVNGKPITVYSGRNQTSFSAVVTPSNQIAVTWYEDLYDTSKVYAQLISSTGEYLWGDHGIEISPTGSIYQKYPQISYENGYFYVGWSDLDVNDVNNFIFRVKGQKLDSAGNHLWGENGKMISESPFNQTPTECMIQQIVNRYFVWCSWDRVYVKLIDENGNTANGWNPDGNAVSDYASDYNIEINPKASAVGDGLTVIWNDYRNNFISSVYAQKFNTDGSYAWNPDGVAIANSNLEQTNPSLFVSDCVYIPWCDNMDGNNWNAAIQKLSLNGEYAWNPQGMYVSEQPYHQTDPVITSLDDQNLLIAWAEAHDYQRDIYIKRLTTNGEFQEEATGIPVCTATNCQFEPQFTSADLDKVYLTWTDARSSGIYSNYGIYLQLIDYSMVSNHDPSVASPSAVLYDNYPNPFNPETTIRFSLATAGKAKLEIFNIKGQIVRTMINDNLEAGIHQLTWNGKNQENCAVGSGVYFYRLVTDNHSVTKKMILMK